MSDASASPIPSPASAAADGPAALSIADFPLRIHAFESPLPGPALAVFGGVHGDETCGSEAIARIVADFDAGRLRLARGRVTFVPVANPLARHLGRREGERNLNRSFVPTAEEGVPPDYEARITDRLCRLLDTHDALLDLHSFQSEGEAFAMIGPRDNDGALEPFARAVEEGQLALHLDTTRVVEGWLDVYAAGLAQRAGGRAPTNGELDFGRGTNEYLRSRGGYGVTLECGQHRDPRAPEVAYRAVRAALRLLKLVAPPTSPDEAAPRSSGSPQLLRLVGVWDREHEDDQFVRDWATFDALRAGEPIGRRADGSLLRAPGAGFIVFPNAIARPGSEWFYFAVPSDRDLGPRRF